MKGSFLTLCINDILHNDIQLNDTLHEGVISDTQHNDIQLNGIQHDGLNFDTQD